MTTINTYSFDNELDLNQLFNLSYNFDLLKGVIDALVKNQKSVNKRLADLEEQNNQKEEKINSLEKINFIK